MADLTAAQMVDALRASASGFDKEIATLIEQQAEQIAVLTERDMRATGQRDDAVTALKSSESEAAALRKVIEDAPHDLGCGYYVDEAKDEIVRTSCTCWKATAL